MSDLLDVRDLVVTARQSGADLVGGVSLRVPTGGSVGILGESGSGKTMMCKALLGILPEGVDVTGGSVAFDGEDLTDASRDEYRTLWGLRIGAVFQDPASFLTPSLRVGSQVAEVLRVRKGLRRAQARAEAIALLAQVGLREPERVYRQYVHELSGGMLQRVLIAIAISCEPELLIADEATTALDVTVQADVLDLIRRLRREKSLSLLMISHDLAVLAHTCDYLYVFRDGVVVEEGPTRRVLHDPQHEYTQLLIRDHEHYGLDRIRIPEGAAQ